jgi:F-type H+-transporting ATPase subunit alpha
MKDFDYYLEKNKEIGYIEQVLHSIVYVGGLPSAKHSELVLFESGSVGQVINLEEGHVEILRLSKNKVRVGDKVARTNEVLKSPVGEGLLDQVIDPLGNLFFEGQGASLKTTEDQRPIDVAPPGIETRSAIVEPLETGVALVDMVVPLGKGQRELVIGDRKTGKTMLLTQAVLTQAARGAICIYAAIGKRKFDIKQIVELFEAQGVSSNVVIVASTSSDPAGLVYLTPYTAMTIAEHFRDQKKDVLVVMDDLTTHAKYYREITLLARRFPGRSSYPGDIFYTHSKLLERAGNFKEGSISCLPVAETVLGDLSGYIQTNIMAMTDGHIFFDSEFANLGRRPAINPFLSVTRVGHQAQSPFMRDLSRELSSFLVRHKKLRDFLHFGAELGENVRRVLDTGDKLIAIFNQPPNLVIPINANVIVIISLWAGFWKDIPVSETKKQAMKLIDVYRSDENFRNQVDNLINTEKDLVGAVNALKDNPTFIQDRIR